MPPYAPAELLSLYQNGVETLPAAEALFGGSRFWVEVSDFVNAKSTLHSVESFLQLDKDQFWTKNFKSTGPGAGAASPADAAASVSPSQIKSDSKDETSITGAGRGGSGGDSADAARLERWLRRWCR